MHQQQENSNGRSVLTSLRALRPPRPLRFSEALQVAELQAARLLELQTIEDAPVPVEAITSLPRLTVEYDRDLPASVSGCSDWDSTSRSWVISINPREPHTRRRFTLLHEYKHIVDHGSAGLVTRPLLQGLRMEPNEYLADYFAGCVLMPRRLLKAAWASGLQTPTGLAAHFDVSPRAVQVRLSQIGLAPDKQPSKTTTVRAHTTRSAGWSHEYLRLNAWTGPRELNGVVTW